MLQGKLWAPISGFYRSKIGGFVTAMCALMVYSSASNLSHHMWKFSLFSQHHYSVYKRSMYDVFCLSIFIASFSAIKPLWAMLYTSEQVRWPDGCSNKWGEMSKALLHTRAVRRTSPAPQHQRRPCPAGAGHALLSWHEDKGHPCRDDRCAGEMLLRTAWLHLLDLLPKAKTSPKRFLCFLLGCDTWLLL